MGKIEMNITTNGKICKLKTKRKEGGRDIVKNVRKRERKRKLATESTSKRQFNYEKSTIRSIFV